MIKVLYGGYLRPFKHVGHHPQFEHIHYPPPGYEFVTGGHFGLRTPARVLKSISSLSCRPVRGVHLPSRAPEYLHHAQWRSFLASSPLGVDTMSRSPLTYQVPVKFSCASLPSYLPRSRSKTDSHRANCDCVFSFHRKLPFLEWSRFGCIMDNDARVSST